MIAWTKLDDDRPPDTSVNVLSGIIRADTGEIEQWPDTSGRCLCRLYALYYSAGTPSRMVWNVPDSQATHVPNYEVKKS